MRKREALPDIGQLPRLGPSELQAIHREMFGAEHPIANCQHLRRKIAWHIQAAKEGALPDAVRAFALSLGPVASEWVLGDGPRGADFYKNPDGEALHLKNWTDSIRSRKPPACPAEEGVKAANGSHLANIALRRERVVRWSEVEA